ncbi:MAG: carboxylesterase/lipase family protein [Bryobacteraceae bacterium]
MNRSEKEFAMNRRGFLGAGVAAAGVLGSGILHPTAFAADAKNAASSPVVDTNSGKIKGLLQDKVYSFKGVPYGAPTGGANRFQPPAKPESWTGVRDTVELGPRSPQVPGAAIPEWMVTGRSEGTGEDCLVLNVWTAGLKDHKRPVMLWLHGGGYAGGSAGWYSYDGTELAKKHDVVVVGVNHRLNIFGYLYLADFGNEKFAQSSNVGQLDIVAALQWVRDNIANFGGDPNNVTIFGQSGGGGKVSTLLAMPAAKGLFHRAIVQSSSNLRGTNRADATKGAEALLAKLNLKPSQLDELQKLPPRRLLQLMQQTPQLRLSPVVDGRTLPNPPFDPGAPEFSADVPLLIGSTETEVTFRTNIEYRQPDDAELRDRLKDEMRVDDATADRLISVYKKGRPGASNLDLFLVMASDNWVRRNLLLEAERKAALNKAPVYTYYFAWRTPVRDGMLRTPHTLEIPFVFDNVDGAKSITGSGQDRYALAEKMSNAWVGFARTGNPNHKGLPNWPSYNAEQRATMIFNNECKMVNDPYKEERLAMNTLRPAADA